MSQKWSLLSITDIHYEMPNANYLDDPKELTWPAARESIFTNFDRIVKNGFGSTPFDLVAVCGDITTHGIAKGFDRFLREAILALQRLVRKSEAICIVPGNHDVVWGLNPTDAGSFGRKFAGFRTVIDQTDSTSCLYPEGQLTENPDDTHLNCDR